MDRWIEWWKKDERYIVWLRAALIACLPVISCLVYCALRGKGLGQVYLPSSWRNDELICYKQVEAVIKYGYPQGYFGFNESHALQLSFAAWSPILMWPWILWGLLFGWNLSSPVVCNIAMMTIAMFLFGLLAKPSRKQTGILTLLFFLYTPFVWYMLSGMPEIICISLLLVFYGLTLAYQQQEKGLLLVFMFVLAGLLTLMRPYMFLFLLLPAFFWIVRGNAGNHNAEEPEKQAEVSGGICEKSEKKVKASERMRRFLKEVASRWKAILGSALFIAAVLGCYAYISHFLTADYFEPIYYLNWFFDFFEKGFMGGLKNLYESLRFSGRNFWAYTREGMISRQAVGAIFCCYIVMLLVLLVQGMRDLFLLCRLHRRKEPSKKVYDQLVIEAHLALSFLGMLAAQLLMKNFYDGCKHLLTFLAMGIFVVSLMRTAYFGKTAVLGVAFAYFLTWNTVNLRDYQVAFEEADMREHICDWEQVLQEEMNLTEEATPNYDNVVIWVFSDILPEGEISTEWQYLYALPPGFGISCCNSGYVTEHFDSLESRYLCVVPGGPVEEGCVLRGYEKIAESERAVLYRRY